MGNTRISGNNVLNLCRRADDIKKGGVEGNKIGGIEIGIATFINEYPIFLL